jgi:hypothetical protein
VFISPGGMVAQLYPKAQGTNFSRLLRHTLALFLFPGRNMGVTNHYCSLIFKAFKRPIRVLATKPKGRGFKPIRNDELPQSSIFCIFNMKFWEELIQLLSLHTSFI